MGITKDEETYTLEALANLLGYKQKRSVENLLRRIECPVASSGSRKLISGKQFRLSLERAAHCLNTSKPGK